MLHHEALKILDSPPLVGHESFHRAAPRDRQIALEQVAVKTGNCTGNLIVMPLQKLVHGVPFLLGSFFKSGKAGTGN